MVGVPSKEVGLEALDRIDDAVAEGAITVDDAALVYRNDKPRDSGVSDKLMKQIGTYIEGSEAGLFILADDSSTLTISAVIEELMAGGAGISYEVIPPEAQAFLLEAIKLGAVD